MGQRSSPPPLVEVAGLQPNHHIYLYETVKKPRKENETLSQPLDQWWSS